MNVLLGGAALASFALVTAATPHIVLLGLVLIFGMIRNVQFNALQTLTYADISPAVLSRATSLGRRGCNNFSMGFGISVSATLLGMLAGPNTLSVVDFHRVFLAVAAIAVLGIPGFLALTPTDGMQVSGHRPRSSPAT